MILIYDAEISGLDRSIQAIGLSYGHKNVNKELAIRLAKKELGYGHDSFLKGIIVHFKLDAPHYFIIQLQRYHFSEIVMSTSKMHSLKNKNFLLENLPDEIDDIIKDRILYLYDRWMLETQNKEDWEKLLANLPLGFNLTMEIVTNYAQLKTIYKQRIEHRLNEWKTFCKWIKSLPFLNEVLE